MNEKEKQEPEADQKSSSVRNLGLGVTIPTMLAASIIVGTVIGYALDRWLKTSPWLLLLFLFLGMVAGVRETIRLVRKMDTKD